MRGDADRLVSKLTENQKRVLAWLFTEGSLKGFEKKYGLTRQRKHALFQSAMSNLLAHYIFRGNLNAPKTKPNES